MVVRAVFLCVWLSLVPGALMAQKAAVQKAAEQEPAHNVFANSPVLQQKVDVQSQGIAIDDLLALLSQKTGVRLTVDKDAADDKIVLFGPPRPLKDLLSDLALLLNDQWLPYKAKGGIDAYELTRSLRARTYESRLASGAVAHALAPLEEQVKALQETPEQLAKRPEKDPIRRNLSKEENRIATQLYASLSQAQRETLFARTFLHFPFAAVDPQQQNLLRKLYTNSIAELNRFSGIHTLNEDPAKSNAPQYHIEEFERHGLQFVIDNGGGVMLPAIHVYGDNGSMRAIYFAELNRRGQWMLPAHGDPYTREPLSKRAALPEANAVNTADREKQWIDRLHKLAETTGLPVMADFYRSPPVHASEEESQSPQEAKRAEANGVDKETVAIGAAKAAGGAATNRTEKDNAEISTGIKALDALCRPVGYLWWTHDKTLLLRKRDWYSQRSYEVPERWLQETLQRMKTQNNMPTAADVLHVRELTPRQILGLNNLHAGDNYALSEWEVTGLPELLTLLHTQGYDNDPKSQKPLATAGTQSFSAKDEALKSLQGGLQAFLSAQSRPLPDAQITQLHVDIAQPQFSLVPEGGFPYVAIMVTWSLGNRVGAYYNVQLPITLPDDRRGQTTIVVQP